MAMAKVADLALVLKTLDGTQMIVAALPHAVETEPAERHSFQVEVFAMAKDVLLTSQTSAGEELAGTTAVHSEEKAKADTLKDEARDIIAAEEAAQSDFNFKTNALDTARKDIALAVRQHSQAEASKKQEWSLHVQRKEGYDRAAFISDSMLNMLKTGGWEDSEAQEEAIEAVVKFLTSIEAEPAMIAAVPGCFNTKPELRGEFDMVVEEGISKAIASHIEVLGKDVAKSSRAVDLISAETLGLWAILDFARESATDAECNLSSAEDSLEAASAKRVQAGKDVAEQSKLVSMMAMRISSQKAAIQQLADAGGALERLRLGEYASEALEAGKEQDEKMEEAAQVENMDVDVAESCSTAVVAEGVLADALPVAMVA